MGTHRIGAGLSLLVLVLCPGAYRSNLDYRYEVIGLLLTWLVLIATGALVPLGLRSSEKCDSALQPASDDQDCSPLAITVAGVSLDNEHQSIDRVPVASRRGHVVVVTACTARTARGAPRQDQPCRR